MKKYFLLFALFGTIILPTFSQSKMLLPKEVYAEMKAKGALKQGVEYVIINNEQKTGSINTEPVKVTPEHLKKMGYKGVNSSTCSCIVPIDGTFNVAEFSGYTAPDYRNDDASTSVKTIPFNFCLYGTNYTQLYINNNGNVSFGSGYSTFSSNPFPDPTFIMVAPFWGDVDTRNTASGLVYYKITPTYMIVKWQNVGYYNSYADKLNTFQLIISNGTDPIIPNGNNIAFCYGDMQWTTGDASQGTNGFGGTPATVGVNQGSPGNNYIQLGRFDQAGVAYDGGYGANDGVSWLDNQTFYFNSCNSTNIAPIANGLNNCDTLRICGLGDTLILNGLFLAPEIGQTTTVSVNLNGMPGASVISNTSGNSANAQVQIISGLANAGNHVITFTATDDGSPVGVTIINLNIYVDTLGLASFNPLITGNLEFCNGGSTTLSVTPTNYDSYYWSTGVSTTSISANSTGQYWVTSKKSGCSKTNFVNVIEHPNPTPVIIGNLFTCSSNPTILYVDSASIYTNFVWSNSSTNDSVSTVSGSFTVTVTDTNGCVGTSPSITVVNASPAVTILGVQPFCPGDSILLTANPTILSGANYAWSTAATTQSDYVYSSGAYNVTVNYSNGCHAADTVTVTANNGPSANFTTNPPGSTNLGAPVNFNDISTVSGGSITTWYWDFGDASGSHPNSQNPIHQYGDNGIYTITLAVQSSDGCWDTIRKNYEIVSEIQVPNVFTPNNAGADGLNQFFYLKNLEYYPSSTLKVYNRWGIKVYESTNYQNNWTGGNHPDGVYYFVLDGPKLKKPLYGFVQILR